LSKQGGDEDDQDINIVLVYEMLLFRFEKDLVVLLDFQP
jgi:hypothetical protein